MIVDYFSNKEAWDEMADPEKIETFSFGMGPDVHFVFCTLHPKGGEEIVFTDVPISLFFAFEAKWKDLHGKTL